jgi:GNAT superfamily N-acetyltransferase
MRNGWPMSSFIIENPQHLGVIDVVKHLADQHRLELGFHARQAYVDSLNKGELLIAKTNGCIVGFVRYHHRRDGCTTLYEIAIAPDMRHKGVGRCLVQALIADCQRVASRCIRLLCPVELPANGFYQALGFVRRARRSRSGSRRPLYEWEFTVLPHRRITFVASLTSSSYDLDCLIRMWEAEGTSTQPFAACIITPLFIEPKAFHYVKYMHERWGIEVIFDSGGFLVLTR